MTRFFAWLRERRIRELEVKLAQVEAAIACDARISQRCGTVYPVAAELQARERAGVLKRLDHLRADSAGSLR